MISYELTRWMAYRWIRHPKMFVYIWIMPVVLSVVAMALYFISPDKPAVFGESGIFSLVFEIFLILPGFFIASLAAVSTFDSPSMDMEMPSPCPTLDMNFGDGSVEVKLTKRMFLGYMFSYLTALSVIIVSFSGIFSKAMTSEAVTRFLRDFECLVSVSLLAIFFYFCFSVFVTLLHGLYFFSEKMHQPS